MKKTVKQFGCGFQKTIDSVSEIQAFQEPLTNSLVAIDVDNTLITPVDLCFRYDKGKNKYRHLFDDLKLARKKNQIPQNQFENIIGHFRLSRKTQLTEKSWPDIFKQLKNRHNNIIAITHLDIGKFGPIESMETWRFRELKHFDLDFSELFTPLEAQQFNRENNGKISYFKGIFITVENTKNKVLKILLEKFLKQKLRRIIFIDDRIEIVEQVSETLAALKMPFETYCYEACKHLPGKPDPKIATFQKQQILDHQIWYSDAQAKNHLEKNN